MSSLPKLKFTQFTCIYVVTNQSLSLNPHTVNISHRKKYSTIFCLQNLSKFKFPLLPPSQSDARGLSQDVKSL